MRSFFGFVFCLTLLFSALAATATETSSLPLGMRDFTHSEANLTVTRTFPAVTSISLATPHVVIQNQTVDYQVYQVFGIPGEPFIPDDGSPTVPQVCRFYRIPDLGNAELVVTNADYDVVDNVNSFPMQPEDAIAGTFARNDDLYTRDSWYPAQVAELSEPMIMRDFRVVMVTLHPVQVNPVTHQARIYRNLSVDIVANDQPAVNELPNPRPPSGAWAPLYRSVIANLDDHALDNMTTTPGSYMILCNSDTSVMPYVDSLFQWKTRKGFKVVIDARPNWVAGTMVTAIQNAYRTWDPPLEFVALMGDPSASFGVEANGNNYDHSFALGNNGDNIEDIGVGRLSGASTGEMLVINNKIMSYERNPLMTDTLWYRKAFLYAGVANQCAGNYTLMLWGRQQFRTNTGVNNITVDTVYGSVNTTTITNQVNSGIGYFLWRGSWLGQMSSSLAGQTIPGGRYPVVLTITCDSGDYTSGLGVSESWLVAGTPNEPRGGVCAIGTATSGTHNPENTCLASGFMYYIADMGVEAVSTALAGAKYQLYYTYGTQPDIYSGGQLAANFSRYCNLLGEPSLSVWTDVPRVLDVRHPTSLNRGARSVDVTVNRAADGVPVADALVVLWKRGTDSTWVKGLTDQTGHITLPVSVNTAGDMYLTVTKHNHKPYLYTIPCVQAAVMPMVSSFTVDDDSTGGTLGNGDGHLNPGETIDLPVYVRNFGNATTATNVSATLSSSDARVSVVNASANYANLAPGDSALGSPPFRIHASSSLPNNVQALLALTIHYSPAGQTAGVVPLTCQAGEAAYLRQHLSPTPFNPGTTTNLQVVLKNQGSLLMRGVTGRLRSLSSYVAVTDSTASFGDMALGLSDSNTADVFTLTSSALTFRGHQAPMMLILTTTDNFVDTVQFIVNVGTALDSDPTGPDAYGYFAYDATDVIYDLHPTFSYADISGIGGTNLNLNDSGDKTTPMPIWSTVRRLPFRFKFYGHVYDSITVCSNGWCAFGDQSWYDGFRNYQMPAMQAPDAMIAPYWDDLTTTGTGHGVFAYSDVGNHRYIIQWKATVMNNTQEQNFEVILYDTTYVPTGDGNGRVLIQYNSVVMNVTHRDDDEAPGCTVGIQAPGCVVGLQYAYEGYRSPGAAAIQNGQAILFTTDVYSGIPQALTLASPNTGQVWFLNTVDTIAWYGGNVNDHIRIQLSRSGPSGSWETLTSSTPNNRTFGYTVMAPTSANCYIRISSVETPSDADTSSGSFTISKMRLLSPNGGDIWYADSTATILWQGGYAATGIRIELSRVGSGGPWEVINGLAPNTGSYTFTVSGATSATCRVRLTSLYDASDNDVSDADFAISSVQTVFLENFESGGAGWTHAAGTGGWRDNWNLSTERAYSATHSYKCGNTGTGNYLDSCDARLTSPAVANLPANATLTFVYQIESELSGAAPDSAYDGGLLEISSDGGAFTRIDPVGGYPKHFRTTAGTGPFTGPMPGQGCWAGTVTTWTMAQVNLTAYAGHSIQLRWRFGSDRNTNAEGWYVDDVRIVAPMVAPPAPVVPVSVTCSLSGTALVLRWADDGNTAYKIYSSLNAGGPFETLEGSTASNSFAVPDSTSSAQKFFIIVGWNGQ